MYIDSIARQEADRRYNRLKKSKSKEDLKRFVDEVIEYANQENFKLAVSKIVNDSQDRMCLNTIQKLILNIAPPFQSSEDFYCFLFGFPVFQWD